MTILLAIMLATPGDVTCILAESNPEQLIAPERTALGAAVNAMHSVPAAAVDFQRCWQKTPGDETSFVCVAGGEYALTDEQWAAADIAGELKDLSDTIVKTEPKTGARPMQALDVAAYGPIVQSVFGRPLDEVYSFRFWRSAGQVLGAHHAIAVRTSTEFKAGRQAEPQTILRGLSQE